MTNEQTIIDEAKKCVKCGLCLPVCPTYYISQNEAESPRGRIAMAQGLAEGTLPASDSLIKHLDNCLHCRACEAACPAKVKFGKIIDNAQQLTYKDRHIKNKKLLELITVSSAQNFIFYSLRFLQKLKIIALFKAFGVTKLFSLSHLEATLPTLQKPFKPKKTLKTTGNIAFFTGCINTYLEPQTLNNAYKLLQHLGYNIETPQTQTCCGALAHHQGNVTLSKKLREKNLKAFAKKYDAIISTTSGCSSHLNEYQNQDNKSSRLPFFEISDFLSQQKFECRPLAKRVMLHIPCTHKNVLKTSKSTLKLLQQIPELKIIESQSKFCCGASGTKMLTAPEQSEKLGLEILNGMQQTNCEILLTTNLGCLLHFKKLARIQGVKISVEHPINLLYQQL